jgi:hypothetical protein
VNRLLQVLPGLIVAVLVPAAYAVPSATSQAEIAHLLQFVGASGCEFYRNGSWYDAPKAQAHLQEKYELLAKGDRINTAEDFIEQAATKSSLSGQPYQVRCGGGAPVTTNQWLHAALAALRRNSSAPIQKAEP